MKDLNELTAAHAPQDGATPRLNFVNVATMADWAEIDADSLARQGFAGELVLAWPNSSALQRWACRTWEGIDSFLALVEAGTVPAVVHNCIYYLQGPPAIKWHEVNGWSWPKPGLILLRTEHAERGEGFALAYFEDYDNITDHATGHRTRWANFTAENINAPTHWAQLTQPKK